MRFFVRWKWGGGCRRHKGQSQTKSESTSLVVQCPIKKRCHPSFIKPTRSWPSLQTVGWVIIGKPVLLTSPNFYFSQPQQFPRFHTISPFLLYKKFQKIFLDAIAFATTSLKHITATIHNRPAL